MTVEIAQQDIDVLKKILRVDGPNFTADIRTFYHKDLQILAEYRQAAYDQGFADAKRAQTGYTLISRSADR